MTRLLGSRGVAALGALLLSLAGGATGASAQVQANLPVLPSYTVAAPMAAQQALSAMSAVGTELPPAVVAVPGSIAELASLVDANSEGDMDAEATCLATAVYFESRGEPLEGQLAVAQVVINRARSGRYPSTYCGVVKQAAQFSFVRAGAFPRVNAAADTWRVAQAIARIAQKQLVAELPSDVLWYHADYVAPRWRQALTQVQKIGAHIFYRA